MPANQHPDFKEELDRLNYTLGYVDKSLEEFEQKKVIEEANLLSMRKRYNSDNSQNYIDMMIQSMLNDRIKLKIKNLKVAQLKPYFSRIDFQEQGKDESEKMYIGKMSLMRNEDNTLIIVDWRAPVANLYYDGRIGSETYNCPDGEISGELLLKRQYVIDNRTLHEILDIDITTNDELLQQSLGTNADNRLKDIVSTIQEEQNKVIRSNMFVPLIIQGAAGSGKTTIALHRIAYLIYTYEDSFEPENFMIIAPNKLFLNYISEVLPELGVDRVRQTTFEELAESIIGKKLKIKDPNQKLMDIIEINNQNTEKISALKSSLIYKDMIETYLKVIEKLILPNDDFKLFGHTVIKLDEIHNLFFKELKFWPINKRIENIKQYLNKRLKDKKEWIIDKLQKDCDSQIARLKLMPETEERRNLIINVLDDKDLKVNKINTFAKTAVDSYIKKVSKNPLQIYKDFITDTKIYNKIAEKKHNIEECEILRIHTEKILQSNYVEIEDLAPLMYIKHRVNGINKEISIKHAVIDEAQDYSIFQFFVLRSIFKDSSFTILGDLCQGIHSFRGINDWNSVKEKVFSEGKCELITLTKSYRTTVEIMEAANKVILSLNDEKLQSAQPVIRHGEKPKIIEKADLKEASNEIYKDILEFKNNGYKSVAIICKTQQECKKVHSYFKKLSEEIELISDKVEKYKGGIVVIPSYLSKGLEFDAVIIANANTENYKMNELDAKLLYVSMTRPLHKLYIYHIGECSSLLKDI